MHVLAVHSIRDTTYRGQPSEAAAACPPPSLRARSSSFAGGVCVLQLLPSFLPSFLASPSCVHQLHLAMAVAAARFALRRFFSISSLVGGSRQAPTPPPKADPSSNLFVSGLSKRTTTEGLREAFAKFGEVVHARVVTDRVSGYSKGFGFVKYASVEEAAKGIEGMDGKFLDGWVIFAEYARPRQPPEVQTQQPSWNSKPHYSSTTEGSSWAASSSPSPWSGNQPPPQGSLPNSPSEQPASWSTQAGPQNYWNNNNMNYQPESQPPQVSWNYQSEQRGSHSLHGSPIASRDNQSGPQGYWSDHSGLPPASWRHSHTGHSSAPWSKSGEPQSSHDYESGTHQASWDDQSSSASTPTSWAASSK